jgi:hypothetical protein
MELTIVFLPAFKHFADLLHWLTSMAIRNNADMNASYMQHIPEISVVLFVVFNGP